jgi:exonuclease III
LESLGLVQQKTASEALKRNSVLIASRDSFQASLPTSSLSGYEHCCVQASFKTLEVLAFYFPQGDAKGPLFNWLLDQKKVLLQKRTMLIGDFNTGIHYLDEQGATFHHADKFEALQSQGWVDAWRCRNQAAREFSWFSERGNGFRIDHALASPTLAPGIATIRYSHVERDLRVSDHSILCVEFGDP